MAERRGGGRVKNKSWQDDGRRRKRKTSIAGRKDGRRSRKKMSRSRSRSSSTSKNKVEVEIEGEGVEGRGGRKEDGGKGRQRKE